MFTRKMKSALTVAIISLFAALLISPTAFGSTSPGDADAMLAEYFKAQTAELRDNCLTNIKSLDDWKQKRLIYRRQLFEMMGLDPMPEKTDLKPVITGTLEQDEFTVEKLYFQSMPRLYVTANLYLPRNLTEPAPTILYVCGHGPVKKNGISYGNKVHYQHHGAWFARNGYVCLVIDSLQMGEIEGIHHGTYRYNMWWWNNRGYTPAGVEAWNCIRALDYLETRKEVDKNRFGVTGRSGGGAYSWWIAALDDRIKVAVPVAGITDLQNHVVDGTVEGHCDCMFFVNTYRWDYPMVPALVAPRPLLISNSDKDSIFPLDGVCRTHLKTRSIYRLYDADANLGLHITEGPHQDTQALRVHAFAWFNRFLKNDSSLIEKTAVPFFEPEQLKVFDKLPEDQINTKIHETFVPQVQTPPDKMVETLRHKCFNGWPAAPGDLDITQAGSTKRRGVAITACDFTPQPNVRLRMFVAAQARGGAKANKVIVRVLDANDWDKWAGAVAAVSQDIVDAEPNAPMLSELRSQVVDTGSVVVMVLPRGIGPTRWNVTDKKMIQIRRRFMLLGQTVDGMRVYDIHRAIEALGRIDATESLPVTIEASGQSAAMAIYAGLYTDGIAELKLHDMPKSNRNGPIILNVSRYSSLPTVIEAESARTKVTVD